MNVYRVQNTNFTPAHDHLVALSLDSAAARIGIAIGYPEPPTAEGGVPDPANQRSANGTDYGMTPALTVDFADLRARHGWCDHQVYILATQGRFPTGLAAPIPLFACTLTERLAPHDLAVRNQFNIIAALVVPFKASGFDDCSLLVNLPGDTGALVVDVGPEPIDHGPGSLADIWPAMLPSIRLAGPATVAAGQSAPVTVQLLDAGGSPIQRAGVEVYFEAVSGSVSKARGLTDASGACALTCSAPGLTAGDSLRVKAGFKFYPGVADLVVGVV